MAKNLITAILAGIIAFAWGMFSWMALPFHSQSIDKLKLEPIVVQAIKQGAPETGMYVYPAMDASKEDMAKTPHVVITTNYKEKNFALCMLTGLIVNVLGALTLTYLVVISKLTSFGDRFKLICKALLFVGIIGLLPNWLWWGFTTHHTVLTFIDLFIAWGLAGALIAKRV